MSRSLPKTNEFDVLNRFKHQFKENLNRSVLNKRAIQFEKLIDITQDQLELPFIDQEIIDEIKTWFNSIYNQSFLKSLITETFFEEIIIHSPRRVQIISPKENQYKKIEISQEDLFLSFHILTDKKNMEWNKNQPFLSFNHRIKNSNLRITLLHPTSYSTDDQNPNEFKVFIRNISSEIYQLKCFLFENASHLFFPKIIKEKRNILISGATGSGKTSFLSSLIQMIKGEHVIVLEDTREINCDNPLFTFLLSNKSPQQSLEKYCEYSLRMRPDRIIIGEMRGSEVIPFTLNMNNGHKGLISTIHSENALEALFRFALLFELMSKESSIKYETILKLAAKNIDYVVHLENKKVKEVIKVFGSDGKNISFERVYFENMKPCSE